MTARLLLRPSHNARMSENHPFTDTRPGASMPDYRSQPRDFLQAHLHEAGRRAHPRARLDEQPTQVPPTAMASQRDAVLALWRAVFG